jgi:hypothetical protein
MIRVSLASVVRRVLGHRSVLAIPPIGAAESLTRLRGNGLRAATRA